MIHGNGVETFYGYDASSRLKTLSHVKGANILTALSYSYDKAGNRDGMDQTRTNIPNLNPSLSYGYDDTNQLLTATSSLSTNVNETFEYDDLGNRLKKAGDTTDAIFDDNNRLLENATHTFIYDDNGNTTSKTNKGNGEVAKYLWDTENQLLEITKHLNSTAPAFDTVKYTYDVL